MLATRKILIGAAAAATVVAVFVALAASGAFNYEVWKREHPLVSPTTVASVRDGTITLADGRFFRPAGVRRPEGVSAADFDRALRTIVAQGVVVTRDLGDGRAFLLAEPKFYNWCGTRNADGIPWKRWAGSYLQCPVSELLIASAYAAPAVDQTGLTARERWRLEGAVQIHGGLEPPTRISDWQNAFRCGNAETT